MSTVATWLAGFARFWYRFIFGDDWTMAAAVIVSLLVTALLQRRGVNMWWLVPLVVVGVVGVSLLRTPPPRPTRREHQE